MNKDITWLLGLALGMLLATITTGTACAQLSRQYVACARGARTEPAMNQCADDEMVRTDAKRKRLYAEILSRAARFRGAVPKIRASETAWLGYEHAYLLALYPGNPRMYGTMHPIDVFLDLAGLIRSHIRELQHLLRQYGKTGSVICQQCN